jgi:hypothetical protein
MMRYHAAADNQVALVTFGSIEALIVASENASLMSSTVFAMLANECGVKVIACRSYTSRRKQFAHANQSRVVTQTYFRPIDISSGHTIGLVSLTYLDKFGVVLQNDDVRC